MSSLFEYPPFKVNQDKYSELLSFCQSIANEQIDFLLIEGAISNNEKILSISNDSTENLLNKLASKSNYIIAVGSCAAYGGVHVKFEQHDDICGITKAIEDKTVLQKEEERADKQIKGKRRGLM